MKALIVIAISLSACTHVDNRDVLKGTKSVTKTGHVDLYTNGAFKIPGTKVHLIPPGPDGFTFAAELAGIKAIKGFQEAVQGAADSVTIITVGGKASIDAAKFIHKSSNRAYRQITKLSRSGGTFLIQKSITAAKDIIGQSWKVSKKTASELKRGGQIIVSGARKLGEQIQTKGLGAAQLTMAATNSGRKKIWSSTKNASENVLQGGANVSDKLGEKIADAGDNLWKRSARSANKNISKLGQSFQKGILRFPHHVKEHGALLVEDLKNISFKKSFQKALDDRRAMSEPTAKLAVTTITNYSKNVSNSFDKASKALSAERFKEEGFALPVLKSLRWALQALLWDATIKPLGTATAASVGYLAVNAIIFPVIVVVREGIATTQVAVRIIWRGSDIGYEVVAPTLEGALAAILATGEIAIGAVAKVGSQIVAKTVQLTGKTVAAASSGVTLASGAAVALTTQVVGTTAGMALVPTSYVGGAVVSGTGQAVGYSVEYIGVPIAAATVGTAIVGSGIALGAAGAVAGGATVVAGEAIGVGQQAVGQTAAAATAVAGVTISTAAGVSLTAYQLARAVVVPVSYQVGAGIVLSYESASQLAAHTLLGVSDMAYLVLSLEGPKWVLYAIRGKLHASKTVASHTVIDLDQMQEGGEEIYKVPVSDEELKKVLKEMVPAKKKDQ